MAEIVETVNEIEFYNARWSQEATEKIPTRKLRRCAEIVRELAKLNLKNPRILDLGCGIGALAGMLQDVGDVTAIELSPVAIELAKERWPRVNFLSGNFFEAELPRDYFDVVVSQEVLEHVDQQKVFADLCLSLLKPSGHLILTTPNATVFRASGKFEKSEEEGGLQPKENLLTNRQVRLLFREQFEILNCYTIIRGGHKGIFRIINSSRLHKYHLWRLITEQLPIGLHTVLVGRAK